MTTNRPFQLLGIQQIALGNEDKEQLKSFWIDIMGLRMISSFQSTSENVDEDICEIGTGPTKVEIDLMQPLDTNAKPKVHEPPLNHIGFWVDNLSKAVEWLEANGVRFTPGGVRKGASGFDVCFIHPKGNESAPIGGCGVLVELVQAPDEVIAAFSREETKELESDGA